ncbi:DUF6807 domain-containing protein [Pleomorphovibrio marinus]|uniref:DUF6807 domain-containing protein n=1 Tax=Pleomorphovibrio marinus TaxID=2164132 RepID=UPI000E0BBF1C|nr:PmoA family protein [Pleomorphovibrio marinus]
MNPLGKTTLILWTLVFFAMDAIAQEQLRAEKIGDRIDVYIGSLFFTSYRFHADEKYPYFYPVNGPSGTSVTSMRNGTYPHHSSLFFGCDKVNGGNYWQEGLDRGQILSIREDLESSEGDQIKIHNECIWTRPGASAPIKDERVITISSPERGIFQIDFEITMEMLEEVFIEKTNHSLFSGRMDPDLSVTNGGVMVNAEGASAEKETFGEASAWVDFSGPRLEGIEGMAILQHPSSKWYPSPWFTRDYGFFSPTPMYWPENEKGTRLSKGEKVTLRYRVLVHQGDHLESKIKERFDTYAKE